MAAPPGFVVRHTLAVCVILTRGFALVEAQAFAGGLGEVYLAGVDVTFHFQAGRNKSTWQAYQGHELGKGCGQPAIAVKCNTRCRVHIFVHIR